MALHASHSHPVLFWKKWPFRWRHGICLFCLPSFPNIFASHFDACTSSFTILSCSLNDKTFKHPGILFSKNLKMFNNPLGSIVLRKEEDSHTEGGEEGNVVGFHSRIQEVSPWNPYLTYLPKLPYYLWFKNMWFKSFFHPKFLSSIFVVNPHTQ